MIIKNVYLHDGRSTLFIPACELTVESDPETGEGVFVFEPIKPKYTTLLLLNSFANDKKS